MILSKKFYLKRAFVNEAYLNFKYLLSSFLIFFVSTKKIKNNFKLKRGLPILTLAKNGGLQCDGCGLCIDYCPTRALDLALTEKNQVVDFKLDILCCITCGICQEVCPIDAIRMGEEAAHANHCEADWVLDAKAMCQLGVVSRL